MVYLHKSLKGLAGILKDTCKNSKDRVILIELFDSLSKDVHGTLELEETRKLKGIKWVNKAFEIKKGNMRIFYTLVNDDIHILHTSIKQKNKTEKTDLLVVKDRIKDIK